jgi:hypothetical protein
MQETALINPINKLFYGMVDISLTENIGIQFFYVVLVLLVEVL